MSKIFKPTNPDPNKIKKCSCEDKHGPKPFNSNSTNKAN